ncbi:MAG TPA: cation-transporting P-type ATPase [Anaeromyxobacteraceae bacterium]|nr:cation-transporting P-type ATPase [Anaeromyxobacteraceae bacterium]
MRGERPWAISAEALARELGSSPAGLDPAEAAARLARGGPNELPEARRRPLGLRLLDQLTHFMALLLWVGGALAFVAGTPQLGWAIWAVVVVNGAFSFWQETRAERALAALRRALPHDARVWRGGSLLVVPARELVPGDLVEVARGDRVSADARLLAADLVRVDLSLLTGESEPAERAAAAAEPECPAAVEATSLVLAGSSVVSGRGRALVYATGRHTELGKVAHLAAAVERVPSTLSMQVDRLVRFITVLSVAIGVAVFALGHLLVGLDLHQGLLLAIGMIVANVPEGLLPTVTLALALGAERLARRRVLVRRMAAVEALSAVSVICTDKTGTLTENRMDVREAWTPAGSSRLGAVDGGAGAMADGPEASVRLLLAAAALCTEAATAVAADGGPAPARDPLEAALLAAARQAGLEPAALARAAPQERLIPFDAHRRLMTVVARWGLPDLWPAQAARLALVKGAPPEVLSRCRLAVRDGRAVPLDAPLRAEAERETDRLAAAGHHTIAVALRDDPGPGGAAELERDLTLLGLLGIMDPPRAGVRHALERCRRAGIRVVMVTGDHGLTAEAVGREVGLLAGRPRVVSGPELASLSDGRLKALLRGGGELVFARVMPEQKLRLVQAFQALGEVVAVTGDGVNDAPALRAAHVGIAMGASGTDVARGAADLVLLDDDFESIAAAVEEGRSIFQNIRKFLAYILTSNVPELTPFLAMVGLGIPPALNILQILAVDLGTDLVPALALGGEPPEPGLMDQPPRRKDVPLLDRALVVRAYLRLGLTQAAASMLAFLGMWWLAGVGFEALRALTPALLSRAASPEALALYRAATTAALCAIVVCQMGNLFACRSERLSAFRVGPISRLLWIGLLVEAALIAAVVYLPPLQAVFLTAPLPPLFWASLLAGPAALLCVDEAAKWLGRRRAGRLRAAAAGPLSRAGARRTSRRGRRPRWAGRG